MTSDVEFDQAQYLDVLEFFSKAVPAYVMRKKGVPVAIGGVYLMNGEWWGYLEVRGRLDAAEAISMIRFMGAWLRQHKMPISVACDARLESAPRLLRLLGFSKTERRYNNMDVWQWQK